MLTPRDDDVVYISPQKEVNLGLWTLFAGAAVFLSLRLWCKWTRRTGLWYDDYILIISWLVLMGNNILTSVEFATGYSTGDWDDKMHILINLSSCGTLLGQAWSKTAFGVTLLRMSNSWQRAIIWFCLISMNSYMLVKVFFQWAKYCGKDDYQQWYRIQGFCINYNFEQNFKEGGNVYNIIMDFVLALFPWLITWPLEMRRKEKIGLCVTLSLGMVVAIVAAIRTSWKSGDIIHDHDELYIWRNGMSMIWYASEVAGTIIVQCIPILRPFLRDFHNSMTSKRLGNTDTGERRGGTWRSTIDTKRGSEHTNNNSDDGKKGGEVIELGKIPEDLREDVREDREVSYSSDPSETDLAKPTTSAGPLTRDSWQFSGVGKYGSTTWIGVEDDAEKGSSPRPQR